VVVIADCTEGGLTAKAVEYWDRAERQARERSALAEATGHFGRALELLAPLAETPARAERGVDLQTALGGALISAKGHAAPETGRAYARAQELCRRVGGSGRSFAPLFGAWAFRMVRAEYAEARTIAEELLDSALRQRDTVGPGRRSSCRRNRLALGGEPVAARASGADPRALRPGKTRVACLPLCPTICGLRALPDWPSRCFSWATRNKPSCVAARRSMLPSGSVIPLTWPIPSTTRACWISCAAMLRPSSGEFRGCIRSWPSRALLNGGPWARPLTAGRSLNAAAPRKGSAAFERASTPTAQPVPRCSCRTSSVLRAQHKEARVERRAAAGCWPRRSTSRAPAASAGSGRSCIVSRESSLWQRGTGQASRLACKVP
jgi:hypothetical protein